MRQAETRQEAAEAEGDALRAENDRLAGEWQVAKDLWEDAVKDRDQIRADYGELRAKCDQLAREAIGAKVAWEEVRAENARLQNLNAGFVQQLLKDQADNERLRTERDTYVDMAQREIEDLREALKQILEDPEARIRDSHRDDGWEAIGEYER